MELLVGVPKLHWSFFASSERILLIIALVAIAMYCCDVCEALIHIGMEDVDEEDLYWLWCVLELLESCETLLDSESHEDLVNNEMTLFESCNTVRYWEVDWWVEFLDELIMISDVDTGIGIVLSS